MLSEDQVYGRIGEDGFQRLTAAFYRAIPTDPILGPLYPPQEMAGAEARLRDFLIGRFGGPLRYIEQRGHPRLRMRHAAFPVDQKARDRWFEIMNHALDEAQLPEDVTALLREFFAHTATFLINRQ